MTLSTVEELKTFVEEIVPADAIAVIFVAAEARAGRSDNFADVAYIDAGRNFRLANRQICYEVGRIQSGTRVAGKFVYIETKRLTVTITGS